MNPKKKPQKKTGSSYRPTDFQADSTAQAATTYTGWTGSSCDFFRSSSSASCDSGGTP